MNRHDAVRWIHGKINEPRPVIDAKTIEAAFGGFADNRVQIVVGTVAWRVVDAPDRKGNRIFHDGFNWVAGVDFYSFENNVIGKGDFACPNPCSAWRKAAK